MVNPDGHRLMLHSHEWPTSGQWARKHKFSTSSQGGAGPDHFRRLLLCNARDMGTLRQQAHPAGECNVKDAVYKVTEVVGRSEEHTSELQSLMRNSYAVFCLKKKKK